NNNHPSNLRPLTYHENMGNRGVGLQARRMPKKDAHLPVGGTRDPHCSKKEQYIGKTTIRGVTHRHTFTTPAAAQHWLAQIRKEHLGATARRDSKGVIVGAPKRA